VRRIKVVAVCPDATGLDRAAHAVGAVDVAGPEAGARPNSLAMVRASAASLKVQRGRHAPAHLCGWPQQERVGRAGAALNRRPIGGGAAGQGIERSRSLATMPGKVDACCRKLHEWMLAQRERAPKGSATAKALDYRLKRWVALTRYPDDGAVPIDSARIYQAPRDREGLSATSLASLSFFRGHQAASE
jgi:hypothetical protein